MTALDSNAKISILSMRDDGPAPEAALVRDIIKRGLFVAPILIGLCAIVWGANGAYSCAYAFAIVFCNFGLAAALVSYTARISYAFMMASMLFGYLLRLALVAVAVFVVRNSSWVELLPLGLTIIFAHLGLLFWEMRYVSLSLAFPGLKPKPSK
ncbi:MAG: ATP synthase subunit I, partial [Acidimicrobiaceae bacterium]|nr:ATP synthase subunit I [Acidimicrobiaceae bacterium]